MLVQRRQWLLCWQQNHTAATIHGAAGALPLVDCIIWSERALYNDRIITHHLVLVRRTTGTTTAAAPA